MYRLATKRSEKISQRKCEHEFIETDNQICTGLLHLTYCYSLRSYVDFGQSCLSGLSLGAFINSRRIRLCTSRL